MYGFRQLASPEAAFPRSGLLVAQFPRRPLLETVWKSEWGMSMTYAPEHEKRLLHRSRRCRMGVLGPLCSGSQQAGKTVNPHHPRDLQRYLLHLEERLRLAAFAPRLPTLGDRLLVV
jgi:hypothetical protein